MESKFNMMEMRFLDGVLQYRFLYPIGSTVISQLPQESWQWSEWKSVPFE